MLEGRVPETIQEVAVSRKFVEKMKEFADWKDGAIGKEIYVTEHSDSSGMNQGILTITGVYEDYRIGLLTRNDERPQHPVYGRSGAVSRFYALCINQGKTAES